MPDVTVQLNGRPITVREGSTVAAALLNAGASCRISVTGEPRTAVCGMGICFECRARVDGIAHQRTCQILCQHGMVVETEP
jgi:predicted molibdopterin-dependent oxidoreductase YjgC